MKAFIPIDKFEQYGVNRCGQVINFYTKKILKPRPNGKGYVSYILYKCSKPYTMLGHRLVAETFIPNPDKLPEVNHKDEDGYNNWENNLEWCTSQYNSEYSKSTPFIVVNPDGEVVGGINLTRFCKENNLTQSAMHKVIAGKRNHHKGWRAYGKM